MANRSLPADPQSAQVEQNLQDASTKGEGGVMPETGEHAVTTARDEGHGGAHAEPAIFGVLKPIATSHSAWLNWRISRWSIYSSGVPRLHTSAPT